MSLRTIKAPTADVSVIVRIVDSTDGTPEQAVVAATAGLGFWYRREGGTLQALAGLNDLATLDAAHNDSGLLHIDDGYYRLDVPDAAFIAGSDGVTIGGVATGMVVVGCYVQLVGYDARTELTAARLTAIDSILTDTAEIGAAGAGLTALGDARLANLDAAVSGRAAAGDAMALTAAAVDAVLDEVVEGAVTMRQMLRLLASFALAKASGGGTTTITFRDLGDTKARITMTVNANTGDRSAIVLDGS